MYNPENFEPKWVKYYQDKKVFKFNPLSKKNKCYVLDMFPYPSGQGLHVGHPRGYTATDIYARYKLLKGFEVLHPIGWDAFGLPAEQYALSTNKHPKDFTLKNISNFRNQLQGLGFCFDYDLEVTTCEPNYYRWTQWMFKKFYEKGLARKIKSEVNWCPGLNTVLANEEIILKDGKYVSERGEYPVEKKELYQWSIDLVYYADRLLNNLDQLDWPEDIKVAQKNWIGKEEGKEYNAYIYVNDKKEHFKIFVRNEDNIQNLSLVILSPKHPILQTYNFQEFEEYFTNWKDKYGFANNLKPDNGVILKNAYVLFNESGPKIPITVSINVDPYFGTLTDYCASKNEILDFWNLKLLNHNTRELEFETKTYFKLRSWIFSRQRFWGEPFPILFDEDNNIVLADDKDLPILLPEILDHTKLQNSVNGPLDNFHDWKIINKNGKVYYRETCVMPQWAGSCWYYIGYIMKALGKNNDYADITNENTKKLIDHLLPVDLYIGGKEHAVLHLLYARVWHYVLFDCGLTSVEEPFKRLFNQGMILGENNEKMSKSKGNVINPMDVIEKYSADTLRAYEMFMGPLGNSFSWSEESLRAMNKWIKRLYTLFSTLKFTDEEPSMEFLQKFKELSSDVEFLVENLKFNVLISKFMVFMNYLKESKSMPLKYAKHFISYISMVCPFVADEIWINLLGMSGSIYESELLWPEFNVKDKIEHYFNLPVQINGKLKSVISVPSNITFDSNSILDYACKKDNNINNIIKKGIIKKIIYLENKILNILLKQELE